MSQWKDEPPPPKGVNQLTRESTAHEKATIDVQSREAPASSPVPSNCSACTLGWHLSMQLKC